MDTFAKLYESQTLGQIVVMKDSNDEGDPSIKFFFQPEGFGVCCFLLNFTAVDEDAAWAKCDKAFDKVDAEMTFELVRKQAAMLEGVSI